MSKAPSAKVFLISEGFRADLVALWNGVVGKLFMHREKVSVVLPCYNQSQHIYKNLDHIRTYLESQDLDYELIAVNDGSTDSTEAELLRARDDFGITVISYPQNRGKGAAVKTGMARASGEYQGFFDTDLAIPIETLDSFLVSLRSGNDIAVASRFLKNSIVRIPVPFYRRILEKGFLFLRNLILNNEDVKDTQCGAKMFTRAVAKKIFPKITVNRFAFDAELIYLAKKFGFSVEEIPFSLQNPEQTSVRVLKDSLSMASDLIRVRIQDWIGKYDDEKKISLTYDDFGINGLCNERIIHLLELGIGDRVAILIHGTVGENERVALLRSQAALDIHLDRHPDLKTHVEPSVGLWKRVGRFLNEFFSNNASIQDLWEEQIMKFQSVFGSIPQGINTHEHVHFFPPYFAVFQDMTNKYDAAYARFGSMGTLFHPTALVLSLLVTINRLFFATRGRDKRYIVSWDWIKHKNDPWLYCRKLARRGEVEVIFHPERDEEFEYLTRHHQELLSV